MKPLLSVFLLLIFSLITTCVLAQKKTKAIGNFKDAFIDKKTGDILVKNLAFIPENSQIAIAIINKNRTKYIGVIRKNDTLKIVKNKEKIFEIGSITKVFTSVLLAHLVKSKKIDTSETIQQQFNFKIKNGGNITLKQLANHTSGLPRLPNNIYLLLSLFPNNPYKNYTPKLLEEYLKTLIKLEYKTGTKNNYSNLGTGLLGYILTKKTKKSYEKLLDEFIFKPLKMSNSSVFLSNIPTQLLVKGRDKNGFITSNWDFTDALVGAGGIKSNIIDMEKFLRKNFENDFIYNLPQQETFTINSKRKVGFGWQILEEKGHKTFWHNGGTGGYRSCMVFNKEQKKGIIVLSNISAFLQNSNIIDIISFQLLKNLK